MFRQIVSEFSTSKDLGTELAAALLFASPDCTKIISLDGRVLYMNENGRCLMEIENLYEVFGADWAKLWPEEMQAEVRTAIAAAQRGELARFQGLCPTATGTPKWWDVIVSPVRREGRVEMLLSVSRDITGLKTAEAQLEAALRSKDDFLANLSHELRTPLTGIIGFAELLGRSDSLTAGERESVVHIEDAGKSLLALMNDMLDLSRAAAGRLRLDPGACDLEELLRSTAGLVAPLLQGKAVRLDCRVDQGLAGPFHLDAARLRQVVLNLLTNAIKFTDAGEILLKAERLPDGQPGAVRILVQDTGEGIAPDVLPALFGRFVQADSSPSRRHAGAGLGLAICKELVELMGGEISVDSVVGRGSTFSFTLPLEPAAAPSDLQAPSEVAAPAARILIADDNPANQKLLGAILSTAGHELSVVSDGAAALAAAQVERFDLVLMDIQMPALDGLTVIRRLRGSPGPNRTVPILAITANVMREQVESYYAAGADGYVAKPFTAAEVLSEVGQALLQTDHVRRGAPKREDLRRIK